MEQRIALIRFFFHHDPVTVEDYARSWRQLEFALKFNDKLKTIEIQRG